jgi:hypothetical protein
MKRTMVVGLAVMLGAALVTVVPGFGQQMSDIKSTKSTSKAKKAKAKTKTKAKSTKSKSTS